MTEPEEKSSKLELRMVIHPDGRLRERSVGLSENDVQGEKKQDLRMVAGAMIRAMYQYGGVGLAAQQVGFPGAMFVTDAQWPATGHYKPRIFLNPNIREFGNATIAIGMGEGCLSVPYPGTRQKVERASTVTVEWRDLNWELHEEKFEGTEAIVMQHEIDHLHGNLYIDHLSQLKRDIIDRKIKKVRRQYKRGFKSTQREIRMAGELKKRTQKRRKNTAKGTR
jgi:peptide deformylase